MQEKILDFLRKNSGYVSGEEISSRLKITRQALWKHIQSLKDSGYNIEAVPHLGYLLVSSPDRLFPSEVAHNLNTEFIGTSTTLSTDGERSRTIGKKIYYFDEASSTMDKALDLGLKGVPEGTIILAETQLKGRGRLGREWLSPKYKGIYLSLILRPQIPPNLAPLLTLLTAVSVCEAVKENVGIEAQIKWPNDILVQNKKLGGILTELNAEMDVVHFVVIGIGLNVNNDKADLISGATSLKEEKKEEVSRVALLRALLRKIEENYVIFQKEGSTAIIDKWRVYNTTLGKRVKIACQKEHLEGTAVDIDNDGGLLIRKDSGITVKVMAGDITHCR